MFVVISLTARQILQLHAFFSDCIVFSDAVLEEAEHAAAVGSDAGIRVEMTAEQYWHLQGHLDDLETRDQALAEGLDISQFLDPHIAQA